MFATKNILSFIFIRYIFFLMCISIYGYISQIYKITFIMSIK